MKQLAKNRYQKAARRPGDARVPRSQVGELLRLSRAEDAEDRLTAAKFLCPCHIRGRIPEVWRAIFRLMEDDDARVRFAAWHTLEDGGLPPEPDSLAWLASRLDQEQDPKVRRFAGQIIGPALAERRRLEDVSLRLLGARAGRRRGKCDFCGERDVEVGRDLETLIPTGSLSRPALICQACLGPTGTARPA
ncbi:MAG: HEAT repeat domain-containing protein [Caulobacteraceae bacterium]